VLLLALLIWWNIQAAMVLIFCGFAGGSFLKWLYYKVTRHKDSIVQPTQQLALETGDELPSVNNDGTH
jgi:formate-dependent nitrite reductase membrane component NrfD